MIARIESLERRTLLHSGMLDPTFGTDGIATLDIGIDNQMRIADFAASDQGAVLAVGDVTGALTGIGLARLISDGEPDPDFGNDGFLVDTPGGMIDGTAIRGQPGTTCFFIAGTRGGGSTGEEQRVVLTKYDRFGRRDRSFDDMGRGSIIVSSLTTARALWVLNDGSILLAGTAINGDAAVVKVNAQAEIVRAFGVDGITQTTARPSTSTLFASSLAIDSEDRILLGFTVEDTGPVQPGTRAFVRRFTSAGAVDFGLAGTGEIKLPDLFNSQSNPDTAMRGLVVGGANSILAYFGQSTGEQLQIIRFTSVGFVDSFFGQAGIAQMPQEFHDVVFPPQARMLIASPSGELVAGAAVSNNPLIPAITRVPVTGVPVGPALEFAGLGDATSLLSNSPDQTLLIGALDQSNGSSAHLLRFGRAFLDPRPTALANIRPVTAGANKGVVQVTYRSDVPIDLTTLDTDDLRVEFPDGSARSGRVTLVTPNSDGTKVTVRYIFAAPGGSWDATDNGDYQIRLRFHAVQDTNGSEVAGLFLGTLTVDL